MEITAHLGAASSLQAQLRAGDTAKFPRTVVRDSAGATVATVDLVHVSGALYRGSWTPTALGSYTAQCTVYTDSGHAAVDATYWPDTDAVLVDAQVAALLGLVGQHKFVDNTVYDAANQMTSCRVRVFATAAEAAAATDGGSEPALATYAVTAVYGTPGRMDTYRSVGP